MEIVIKAIESPPHRGQSDAWHKRNIYKRGDPVTVVHDGHEWGRKETIPLFWRVRIPGVDRQHGHLFCVPWHMGLWKPGEEPGWHMRRRFNFMPELLSPRLRLALFNGEIVNLSWEQWNRMLVNRGARTDNSIIVRAA